jgi:tetratricopeptide (TPR) repeat protein
VIRRIVIISVLTAVGLGSIIFGPAQGASKRIPFFSFGGRFAAKPAASSPFSKALAHYTMGIIYDNDGRFEDAIGEYKKAISFDPGVSYVHTRLAVGYFLTKKEKEALAELDIAEKLDPGDMKPRFIAAIIHTSAKRFDLAEKKCEEMVRLDPDSIWAISSLADVFVLQEKMLEASLLYEKLLEKDKSPALFFNLGVIYSRIG